MERKLRGGEAKGRLDLEFLETPDDLGTILRHGRVDHLRQMVDGQQDILGRAGHADARWLLVGFSLADCF